MGITTAEVLRSAMEDPDNEAGQKAAEATAEGGLVPDEIVISLVVNRLLQPDCLAHGWILDGFPRTAAQAAAMEKNFVAPNKVIVLECPDAVILQRVTGRRLDADTGNVYHL